MNALVCTNDLWEEWGLQIPNSRHPHSEMRMNESRIVIHGGGYASRIRRERLVRICAYIGAVSGVIAAVASIVALLR
ncbi:MAG: hypothetical protein IK124_09075 [Prevotella sp.]|nr:hypothetical protein [Prevotella sp.]